MKKKITRIKIKLGKEGHAYLVAPSKGCDEAVYWLHRMLVGCDKIVIEVER